MEELADSMGPQRWLTPTGCATVSLPRPGDCVLDPWQGQVSWAQRLFGPNRTRKDLGLFDGLGLKNLFAKDLRIVAQVFAKDLPRTQFAS